MLGVYAVLRQQHIVPEMQPEAATLGPSPVHVDDRKELPLRYPTPSKEVAHEKKQKPTGR
jgi:hypothetical protein